MIYTDEMYHFGVKGMKWGVRNAETKARYARDGHMSKRQAKKAIKRAKRQYRKETGTWMTTGKNVAKVDKEKEQYRSKDKKLNDIASKRDKIESKIDENEDIIEENKRNKQAVTDSQNSPYSTSWSRREAEERYLESRKKASKASDKLDILYDYYDKLDSEWGERSREIDSKFLDKYKNAVVKDLGIDDIEAGRKMLEKYGLYKKALRGRNIK